eukprot:1663551-Amphidinium_carterae.1
MRLRMLRVALSVSWATLDVCGRLPPRNEVLARRGTLFGAAALGKKQLDSCHAAPNMTAPAKLTGATKSGVMQLETRIE